jgi:hypothetical protein
MPQHIHDFFEEKARAGDGQYAVAFAILELAEQQKATAKALDSMGMNNMVPAGVPGALEMIGMQMKDIAAALGQIAVSGTD